MQCCSLAAPRPAARLRISRRAHKQSIIASLYHNIQILSMLALISYLLDLCRTVDIVHPLLTPFLPNLLRPNLLRPMVEPFYQPGNGLSRWKSSTYGLAPPRLQGYYNLHAGGCLVDILSTNRKKNVPNLDTFVRRILTTTGQEAIIKGKKDGLPGCCREVGQLVKFLA